LKYLRTLFLTVTIVLSFSLINYASASYVSLCDAALQGYGVDDQGETYAYVLYGNSYAESRANGWTLGTRVYYSINDTSDQSWSNYANANFRQEFVVTDNTVASIITFAYDGSMSVSGENVDFDGTWYGMGTDIWVNEYDGAGVYTDSKYDNYDMRISSENGDEYGTWDYSGTFQITYAVDELTYGETFFLEPSLNSFFEAEGVGFLGSGNVVFDNNFYNSLRLVSVEGGIEAVGAPVPIPGAVWLLGSGLLGFIGIGFRRKQKS